VNEDFSLFMNDLKFAFRQLLKNPGFTAVAVVTLALGIGANTAVFNLFNALFLKSPPHVAKARELVEVWKQTPTDGRLLAFSYPEYVHLRNHNTTLTGLASRQQVYLADTETARELFGEIVSGDYFRLLGVQPWRGRFFLPEEDAVPCRDPVVVLSYAFWHSRFLGQETCIGGSLVVGGNAYRIVGVAPPGFQGARLGAPVDVWLPNMMATIAGRDSTLLRSAEDFELIGRAKRWVSLTAVTAELAMLLRQLESVPITSETRPQLHVAPLLSLTSDRRLENAFRGETLPLPWVLAVAGSFLLLIVTCNLAGLLLARGITRQREIALRLSLGATRGRMLRQFLTESMLLTSLGGGLGLALGVRASAVLANYYAVEVEGVAPIYDLSFDVRAFGFSLLLVTLVGVLLGVAPALGAARTRLMPAIKGGAAAFGSRRFGLRTTLVVAQIAFSFALLAATGLLLQSLNTLTRNPGFDSAHVLFLRMKPHLSGYDSAKSLAYLREVQRRLESSALVESVAFAAFPPMRDWAWGAKIEVPGKPDFSVKALHNRVSADFFSTLHITLLSGRTFTAADFEGKPHTAIVNESLGRRLWSDGFPLGRSILINGQPHEVVGFVRYDNFPKHGEPPKAYLFTPEFGGNRMFVRVKGDEVAALAQLKREITAVDPGVPVSEQLPLGVLLGNFFMPAALASSAMGYTGLLALVLCATAIFGVLALAVAQRTKEIGVRMALGARESSILRSVLCSGLTTVLIGLFAGVALTALSARLLSALLYGVGGVDVVTYTIAAFVLLAAATVACWVPARRASKVDPMEALRYE